MMEVKWEAGHETRLQNRVASPVLSFDIFDCLRFAF
jgi:hypothetical protein